LAEFFDICGKGITISKFKFNFQAKSKTGVE
jgi:hypothetical protein